MELAPIGLGLPLGLGDPLLAAAPGLAGVGREEVGVDLLGLVAGRSARPRAPARGPAGRDGPAARRPGPRPGRRAARARPRRLRVEAEALDPGERGRARGPGPARRGDRRRGRPAGAATAGSDGRPGSARPAGGGLRRRPGRSGRAGGRRRLGGRGIDGRPAPGRAGTGAERRRGELVIDQHRGHGREDEQRRDQHPGDAALAVLDDHPGRRLGGRRLLGRVADLDHPVFDAFVAHRSISPAVDPSTAAAAADARPADGLAVGLQQRLDLGRRGDAQLGQDRRAARPGRGPAVTSSIGRPATCSSATWRTLTPSVIRLLGQRRGGVVADPGGQRGAHRQAQLDQVAASGLVGLDPDDPDDLLAAQVLLGVDALLGQVPGGAGEQVDRLEQVVGDHRHHHVEVEVRPQGVGPGDRRVVADDLRPDHHHRLGDDRVDLARHDRAARLELRDLDLADPAPGARGEPADVVGDVREADGHRLEGARRPRRRRRGWPSPRSSWRPGGTRGRCRGRAARPSAGGTRRGC